MTTTHPRRWLAAAFLAGLVARLVAWHQEGILHIDEQLQVLEPAWWHLSGAGLAAWEWRDGIRSWVLPGYHGAWMGLLSSLGVSRGATMASLIRLHWALLSLLLVGAAYRAGCSLTRRLLAPASPDPAADSLGGLLAAWLCALHPLLVSYAPHPLSEAPSMLCLVLAFALALEASTPRGWAAVGLLLALGVGFKISNLPLVLGPALLLLQRGPRAVGWMGLGAAAPVLLFGLVDLLTWGRFLGSFIAYLRFNLVAGKAADFGTEPWPWYLSLLRGAWPEAFALVLVPVIFGLRATWPFLLSAAALVGLLSTQGHKEERFIIAVWPLLLIAAAGVAGAWLARAGAPGAPGGRAALRLRLAVVGVGALVICGDGLVRVGARRGTTSRAWLEGQAAAARDPGAGALMIEDNFFVGGGAMWFGGGTNLQLGYAAPVLDNPLVSHVLVRKDSDKEHRARDLGFVPVWARADVVLLRRR